MKLFISFLLLIASFNIHAAETKNINLDMQQVSITELTQAVIKGILNRDYVLTDSVEIPDKKITVELKNQSPDQILGFLKSTLATHQLALVDRGGVLTIDQLILDDDSATSETMIEKEQGFSNPLNRKKTEFFIYRSKYRPLNDFPSFFTNVSAASSGTVQSVTVDNDIALIRGSAEFVAMAKSVILQYDRPINEIEIKASIVEFTTSDTSSLGVFGALKLLGDKLNIQIGDSNIKRDFFSFKTSSFDLVMSAVANDSRFNILETSTIRLVSGKAGRINVGQEVPVLGQFTLDQQGRPIQSVSYRSSGLIVDIKPQVISNQVHADIMQQLSSFAVTSTSNIDSPTLLKREISTNLTAPFNEVILIGGLDEQRDTVAAAKLFGFTLGKNDTLTKTSLFLILEFNRR